VRRASYGSQPSDDQMSLSKGLRLQEPWRAARCAARPELLHPGTRGTPRRPGRRRRYAHPDPRPVRPAPRRARVDCGPASRSGQDGPPRPSTRPTWRVGGDARPYVQFCRRTGGAMRGAGARAHPYAPPARMWWLLPGLDDWARRGRAAAAAADAVLDRVQTEQALVVNVRSSAWS